MLRPHLEASWLLGLQHQPGQVNTALEPMTMHCD